ncbi:ABC transporter permease [Emticicia sp. C21]|uniref:ABC transporter permease n=1 Tax=Emticicia sp. C21 TaxID=2302915 RepID=UPI000E3429D0|nr:ABC transporter permease [Emticicia sp. C21]RFS17785.1 ABC transporter permease [Emticicia sp. C21]
MTNNKLPTPPRWPDRLLEWFLSPDMKEDVQGDLHEFYQKRITQVSKRQADKDYWRAALQYLTPYFFSNQSSNHNSTISLSPIMLRNYLKIAWRNLMLRKAYTAINILGLAIGLASCLLIVLFIQHELSYDKYHAKADRTFRMTISGALGGKEIKSAHASVPAGPALAREIPGVEAFTRLYHDGTFIVKNATESFKEERVVFPDSNLFEVFSVPLLKGNPKTVLREPNTMVITETIATKYFGDSDPIGKTLTLGEKDVYRITGVCKDVPSNTHFHYNIFASINGIKLREKWLASGAYTYIVLRDGYSLEKLNAAMPAIVDKYVAPEIQEFLGITLAEFKKRGDAFGFEFQPIKDIHLTSHLDGEIEANSDTKYVYIFSAIALFILLIACINFMNLSTASSANRAKEVGVRKVLGSLQGQLIGQFLSESVLITFMALSVALVIVAIALPYFNDLSGKSFEVSVLIKGMMIPFILTACLFIGLLAGSYPAFFLSAFKPVSVLKGKINAGFKSSWLRSTLVTTQFVVSIGMIISTMVVYRQLNYIQNKKVGFDKEQILVLHDTYVLGQQLNTLKNEIKQLSQVANATMAGYIPAGASNGAADGFELANGSDHPITYRDQTYYIDDDYLPTLGIGLAAGRNFSRNVRSDTAAILINEAAAKEFGFRNPIGQRLTSVGDSPASKRTFTIIGVVKDFHFESIHNRIAPLVMYYGADTYQMAIRVRTSDIPGLLDILEQKWKSHTDNPFSYSFLNDRFNKTYQSEQRTGQLFSVFASLTIIISCLGLFGLAMFTAQQRTKEIGVRKVLGASVMSIIVLMSKDFIRLILIAILIVSPIAWYIMNQWLQDFAYRVELSWWIFAVAGLLAIIVALLTVSFQSIKAALMNPIKSLKSE